MPDPLQDNRVARFLAEMRQRVSARHPGVARRGPLIRSAIAAAAILYALNYFGGVLHGHYAIDDWLFWKFAKSCAWVGFWLLGCFLGGLAIVEKLTPSLPLRERFTQALAAGVYAFYLLQFVAGILGILGAVWAVALPLGMAAVGGVASRNTWRRIWRHRNQTTSVITFRMAWWQVPLVLYGSASLLLIYLKTLSPRNIAFDSHWYHLGLAQGWGADGRIGPSVEGWFYEAIPNLAAVLYSWPFTLPGLDLFEIVTVAAHQEVVLFIATLAQIPVLARWLVPKARMGVAWVALFTFPSVFIYDASLHTGNDHIAAFFAVPVFLALRRTFVQMSWRHAVLLAICAAGAIMTKYQAVAAVVGPAIALVARGIYLGARGRAGRAWLTTPIVTLVVGLMLTAPLWAKNLAWYGDPFYPALHNHLDVRPTNPDFAKLVEWNWKRQVARPEGTKREIIEETVRSGFDHSFRAFSSATRFHGKKPYFGSLFVLAFLWLPFVRGSKRTWGLMAASQAGVFVWYYMSYVERYLQAIVPWMAAAVAAAVVLAWRQGWPSRIAVSALVALQVIWGGDANWLRTHAMAKDPLDHTVRLLSAGYSNERNLHEHVSGLQAIGKKLPPGARVLLHDSNPRLGLRAHVITDMAGLQGRIRYGVLESPAEVHALFTDMGVTHVVWRRGHSYGFESLAGDLRFHEFALHGVQGHAQGGTSWGAIDPKPPQIPGDNIVVYAGCSAPFEAGLYHLRDMNVLHRSVRDHGRKRGFAPLPTTKAAAREAVENAEFVVFGTRPKCHGKVPNPPPGFIKAADRRKEQLWVRRPIRKKR